MNTNQTMAFAVSAQRSKLEKSGIVLPKVKTIREILQIMIKTAIASESHESRRRFIRNKRTEIFKYISSSSNWQDITGDMDNWNNIQIFTNITCELQITFMPMDIIVKYTPELKR